MSDYNNHLDSERMAEQNMNQQLNDFDDETPSDKVLALVKFLDCDADEIQEEDDDTFEYGNQRYKVYTENEAESAYDKYLDYEIEELVMGQIPKHLQFYFNYEKYKRDARISGGRGAMATYNGAEEEEKINGEWYFIYRVG